MQPVSSVWGPLAFLPLTLSLLSDAGALTSTFHMSLMNSDVEDLPLAYCLHRFKVYSSVALSTLTVLFDYHRGLVPELFHHPKWKPHAY